MLVGCSKEPIREKPVEPPADTVKVATFESGIFVINEGNFNWGNASVTYLDTKTNAVVQDIFHLANQRSLGDVAESMKISGKHGYLVINNSNKIEVVTTKDFKSVTSISGLSSPRFLELIDSTKAYVTNLQKNISILDLTNNTVSGTIKTSTWTENLLRYDKYMLVTSIGSFSEPSSGRISQIFVINTETDKIIDSIQTGKEPIGLVIDKKQKVWVLCSGGYDNFESPSLIRINPELRIVEKIFTFPVSQKVPSRLCMNPTGDTLYYLMGGVYQMPVASVVLPEQPLINSAGRLLYGLDIHPVTGNLFISDAVDYVQNGMVYQYKSNGTLISNYKAGRIPGSFCFTKNSAK